jgi:hypothetical protein
MGALINDRRECLALPVPMSHREPAGSVPQTKRTLKDSTFRLH